MHQYHTAALRHAMDVIVETGRPVILDRWWPTEAIYAEVFREGTRWPHLGRMLDRAATTLGVQYIMCLPGDVDRYRNRFTELVASRRELYTNLDQMLRVYKKFWALWRGSDGDLDVGYLHTLTREGVKWRRNWHKYDFHAGDDAELLANQVIAAARADQMEVKVMDVMGNYDGQILMVGDKPNPKGRRTRRPWPFFEYGNCSLWLARMMDELDLDESKFAFVNVNVPGGAAHVRRWYHAQYRPVVALGNNVVAWLPRVPYVKLPHPSAARRFPSYGRKFRDQLLEVYNDVS